METRLKTTNHAAHSLYYHVILTIKYRNKCLTGEMLDRLRELFAKGCVQWRCRLVEFGGKPVSGTTPTRWSLPEAMPIWRSYWITFKTRSGHRANTPLTHD